MEKIILKISLVTPFVLYIIGVIYYVKFFKNDNAGFDTTIEKVFYSIGCTIAILSWPIILVANIFRKRDGK